MEKLIEAVESTRQTIEEISIEDLKEEIDRTMCDLFDFTNDDLEVMEGYLKCSNSPYLYPVATKSNSK